MSKLAGIHQGKTPYRKHYIREWMEARNMEPMDLLRAVNDADTSLPPIDKSQVYRWIDGQLPQRPMMVRLAAALQVEGPETLLRHPDDDWLAQFFKDRDAAERERIKKAMELAWPRKTGTDQ